LFTELDEYNQVTADDVQRVAQKYLLEGTRTVVFTYAPAKGDAK
jgi:predicted Zn-dependent peptidase